MTLARPETDPNVTPRRLLLLAVPAILVGVVSALILWTLDRVADALSNVIWDTLPGALNVDPNGWWIILVLTVTGLAIGIALQVLPGHGGPDSATTELIGKPLPLRTLPGLALVTLLGLAGGVSLGPENPIIAINCAIMVAIFARLIPQVSLTDRDAPGGGSDGRGPVRHAGGGGAGVHRPGRRRQSRRLALGQAVPAPRGRGSGIHHDAPSGRSPVRVRHARVRPASGARHPDRRADRVRGDGRGACRTLRLSARLPRAARAAAPHHHHDRRRAHPRHPRLHRRAPSRCSRASRRWASC